jgi:AraC-like DNA-binding protein
VDALSTILRSVRLGSSLLSRARFTAPWAVLSNGAPCAIFHAVVAGRCFVHRHGDAAPKALAQGDVVVLSHGDRHVMCDDPSTPVAPVTSLEPRPGESGVPALEYGGPGTETRILCGKLELDHDGGAALMRLLPPLLHVRAESAPLAPWVGTTLEMLDHEVLRAEPGSQEMISRLSDILFLQVLRRYVASPGSPVRGWLAAVRDPDIGRALALIHAEPAALSSAAALGARVGMSRTRFFERFTELVGEPPARYVARWRAHAAADLMCKSALSTAQVAERVGYASEDAFTKVFKRHLGTSPSAYRRQQQRRA